jgi:hypothetical protein
MNYINELGYTEYINCYLVSKGIRSGYLLQFIDYDETSHKDPITNKKLEIIIRLFDNLKYTHFNQGTIISLTFYDIDDLNIDKNNILSTILDYQCNQSDMKYIDYASYVYDIYAILKNNKKILLFSYNSCNSYNCDFKIIQLIDNYNDKLQLLNDNNNIIESINFIKNAFFNEDYYIKLLTDSNYKILPKDCKGIDNYLYNIGFSKRLNAFTCFNYDNNIHRGILIGLLTYSKYPPIEPFYPLSNYSNKLKQVDKQISKWENTILDILNKTK